MKAVRRALAVSLLLTGAAGAEPGPNVRLRDSGLSVVVVTDRFRSAALQLGIELGHIVRWGGFLEVGAVWPRQTPDTFASGGPLMGLGASFAVQFADAAAFLTTSELAVSLVGCHGNRVTCAGIVGASPSEEHLDLVFGQWVTRSGLRLTLFPDGRGTGLDLFFGPSWKQGVGAGGVDLPNGLGLSLAVGIGSHNK